MFFKFWTANKEFIKKQDGATAIEYGLIAAGVAVAISAVVFTFGGDLSGFFKKNEAPVAEEKAVETPKQAPKTK